MFLSDQISSIASTYMHRYTLAQIHTQSEGVATSSSHSSQISLPNFFISNLCCSMLFQIVDLRLLIEILQKKNTHQSQGRIVPMYMGLSPFTLSVLTASLGTNFVFGTEEKFKRWKLVPAACLQSSGHWATQNVHSQLSTPTQFWEKSTSVPSLPFHKGRN